jgi:hypothetical protein
MTVSEVISLAGHLQLLQHTPVFHGQRHLQSNVFESRLDLWRSPFELHSDLLDSGKLELYFTRNGLKATGPNLFLSSPTGYCFRACGAFRYITHINVQRSKRTIRTPLCKTGICTIDTLRNTFWGVCWAEVFGVKDFRRSVSVSSRSLSSWHSDIKRNEFRRLII